MDSLVDRALEHLASEREQGTRQHNVVAVDWAQGDHILAPRAALTVVDEERNLWRVTGGEWLAAEHTVALEEVR
jgi:hypothetical protein